MSARVIVKHRETEKRTAAYTLPAIYYLCQVNLNVPTDYPLNEKNREFRRSRLSLFSSNLGNKSIRNRFVAHRAERNAGKALGASLQIPGAVSKDSNVSFTVTVIIG